MTPSCKHKGYICHALVERYHRSYKYECVIVHRPGTLQEASEVTRAYQEHYKMYRPLRGHNDGESFSP
jgi:Integrase core domain